MTNWHQNGEIYKTYFRTWSHRLLKPRQKEKEKEIAKAKEKEK
jgi:hypothetical protein